MALSVRVRFETFKRDGFTCQYCGRRSPDVVLEVDHIVPVSAGGSDDPINLRTSCWDCNRGKSNKPLSEVVTGEDPHDRAVLLLERERQLQEYNRVLAQVEDRIAVDMVDLASLWCEELDGSALGTSDWTWLHNLLQRCPKAIVERAMRLAASAKKTDSLAYVNACLRNWQERGEF